jgi:small subunit ribosomal protein S5e
LIFSPKADEDNNAQEIKLYGKWSLDDVEVSDIALQDYIAVKGKGAAYLAHTAKRYAKKKFRKAQCPIVERIAVSMMRHGRNNGRFVLCTIKHKWNTIT